MVELSADPSSPPGPVKRYEELLLLTTLHLDVTASDKSPTNLVAVETPVTNASPSELSVTPDPTLIEVAVRIPTLYFSVPRPTVRSDPTLTN